MEYKIPNKNEVDLFVPEYKTSHNGEKEKNLQYGEIRGRVEADLWL